MPNVTISALPDAVLPLDAPNTFFEVQTLESGVTVSRKVTADNIVITASGMIMGTGVVDPSTALPYDYDAELTFENANALLTARLGWDGSSSLQLESLAFGAPINIIGRDAGGGAVNAMTFAPSGVMTLNQGAINIDANGNIILEYDVLGGNTGIEYQFTQDRINMIDRASGTINQIVFSQGSFIVVEQGHVGLDSDGVVRLYSSLTAGPAIEARTSGTDWDVLTVNVPSGSCELRSLNVGVTHLALSTNNQSISIYGTSTDDPAVPGNSQDTRISFRNANVDNIGNFGYSGTNFILDVNQRGSNLILRTTDDAGTVVQGFRADPNVDTQIGHGPSNAFVARTVTPASGGLEIDNQATGIGFARVLTTADLTGVAFPIQALDNDQIQWGTGNDVQQYFDATDMRFDAVAGVDFRFSSAATALLELVGTGLNLDATLGTRADSGGVAWYWDESVTTGKIRQTSAAGVLEDDWITMVINGAVAVFFNGANVAQTMAAASGGLQVNNTLTGGGFERVLTASDISGSPFTEIILTNSNVIDLVDTDVALNIGAAVPGSNPHLELGLFGVGSGIQAKADATTIDTLDINPLGGTVNIGPPASAAVAGGANLRFANGAGSGGNIVETTISGIILEGRTGANTILDFHQVSGNLAMRQVWNGANFQFDGFVDSMEITFNARDSGSVNRQLLHMDPDDNIALFDQGVEVARTLGASAGGWEVNNTLTGAGFERVLTTSDLSGAAEFLFYGILEGDETFVTDTTIRYPAELTFSLPGDEPPGRVFSVEYKVLLGATASGTTPGVRLRLDHTGSVAHLTGSHANCIAVEGIGTGGPAAATITSYRGDLDVTETGIALSGNTTGDCDRLDCMLEFGTTNNFPAGDVRLGFAQNVSDAATLFIFEGTFLRIKSEIL